MSHLLHMDNARINKLVCKSAFNTQNNINLLHFQKAYHFRLRYKMNNNTRNKFTEKNKLNSGIWGGSDWQGTAYTYSYQTFRLWYENTLSPL